MAIEWHTTAHAGSTMRMYMAQPYTTTAAPLVLVLQHRGGVDEHMQDMVHRLFREGYTVIAPDLFHRLGPEVPADERVHRLRDPEIVQDCQAAIAYARAHGLPINRIGVVGFCSGGRSAYLAAAELPDINAAAVFYGGNTKVAKGDTASPFEKSARITCPVIGFFGADDTNPSPQDVQDLGQALQRQGTWYEWHTYQDTGHAFHNFKSSHYRPRAAAASWHTLLGFFDQHLRHPAGMAV